MQELKESENAHVMVEEARGNYSIKTHMSSQHKINVQNPEKLFHITDIIIEKPKNFNLHIWHNMSKSTQFTSVKP